MPTKPNSRFDAQAQLSRSKSKSSLLRVNQRIRAPEVRVILANGEMLGVLPTHEALRRAREEDLDLVEVDAKATPPVCKILDFGKHRYEERKREAATKRNASVAVEVKEIRLRPKTDDHDLAHKATAVRCFLEAGHSVKLTVRFRGREITHPEKGREKLDAILQTLVDVANITSAGAAARSARMDGRTMSVMLTSKRSPRRS